MSDDRLDKLEARVADLEAFKEKVKRHMMVSSLKETLLNAGDAVRLTKEFNGISPGHYCKSCFSKTNEFFPLDQLPPKFQTSVEDSLKRYKCPNCGEKKAIYTGNEPFFS